MQKGFTITYEYGGNLYVNTTNRCNFNCNFCLRHNQSSGGSIYTHNLWLEREPTREEILASIESHDLSKYEQLAFVGFGEPVYRLEDICWVIDQMKAKGEKIFNEVSKKAWEEWQAHQTMLINERRLNMMDPEDRKFIQQEMDKFLAGEEYAQAEGYVPPSA